MIITAMLSIYLFILVEEGINHEKGKCFLLDTPKSNKNPPKE